MCVRPYFCWVLLGWGTLAQGSGIIQGVRLTTPGSLGPLTSRARRRHVSGKTPLHFTCCKWLKKLSPKPQQVFSFPIGLMLARIWHTTVSCVAGHVFNKVKYGYAFWEIVCWLSKGVWSSENRSWGVASGLLPALLFLFGVGFLEDATFFLVTLGLLRVILRSLKEQSRGRKLITWLCIPEGRQPEKWRKGHNAGLLTWHGCAHAH